MNQDSQNEADAIRSDIDVTRRRMDDTMDALQNRLQGRHLIDEVLGFFRGKAGDGDSRMQHMKENISQTASTAMHSVVDTVKANPLPALMIGAGVAWMIYSSRRSHTAGDWSESETSFSDDVRLSQVQYDPDYADRPLDYPTATSPGQSELGMGQESKWGEMSHTIGDKASAAKEAMREKMSAMKQRAGEKMQGIRQRAGEMSSQAREKAQVAYGQARERVATTAQEHPLELGLGLLATGLLIGLAIPTPGPVNRRLGPAADRLRDRARETTREMLDKGRRVARSAAEAAKEEARAQGLTPEGLREKASAVAEHTKEAAAETARREGLTNQGSDSFQDPSGSDPSVARPGM